MAVYNLEEQENIEALKAWWKQYGRMVISAAVAFVLGVGGIQIWRYYKTQQALGAAAVYLDLEQSVKVGNVEKAGTLEAKLRDDYARTTYAPRGAMLYGKLLVDKGQEDKAASALAWAAGNAKDPAVGALANLRLAAVLLDLGKYDEALKAVSNPPTDPFAALFADTRGDILVAQGKKEDAKGAYQIALDKLPKTSAYRNVVEIKREALGIK
ncbi:MAG: tetratricopeptide repeat protein [Betaproteobacteria bacterium]|nr:tetratricopeptide repeat protein [Betaproteobacteria bacterium]